MRRVYKEDNPINTILKIKKILCKLGIVTYEACIANPYHNIHSCRLQTVESQGEFGQNGKGLNLEYSLASAHAEFMERLQNGFFLGNSNLSLSNLKRIKDKNGFYFFPDEKQISKDYFLSLPAKYLKDIFGDMSMDETDKKLTKYYTRIKENGNDGVTAVPFYDYTEKEIIYLPYNITMMMTGSNGMAAGNSTEEGIFQALCELFERKAATAVYYEQLTPPTIPESFLKKYPKLYLIIKEMENNGYKVIVKDFSLGKSIPVLGTIIINNKGNKYKLNVGADTSFEIALSRTLTEIHQGFKDQEIFDSRLLDIPKVEHPYFIDNSQESLDKRLNEITKFKIDGSGVFPMSLFNEKESYSFNSDTFIEKTTYAEEVKYLLDLISNIGERIFIRDASFLGFPSFYIYVTEMSLLGKKNSYMPTSTANVNIDWNLSSDGVEKLFDNLQELFSNENNLKYLLANYPVKESKGIIDDKMCELLKLEFDHNFYWSVLPISYFLTIAAFLLKRYSDASEYLRIYLSTMKMSDSSYYRNALDYFTCLQNNKSVDYINNHIDKEIIQNFNENKLINAIDYPMCPNCDKCKLNANCKTKSKLDICNNIMNEMKNNLVNQEAFSIL